MGRDPELYPKLSATGSHAMRARAGFQPHAAGIFCLTGLFVDFSEKELYLLLIYIYFAIFTIYLFVVVVLQLAYTTTPVQLSTA